MAPSVVEISASGFSASGAAGTAVLTRQRGIGSGVVLSADGYVITNRHVVEGARSIQVLLRADGEDAGQSILRPPGQAVGAVLVGSDEETDLALLKLDRRELPALELGDSDALRAGDLVLAIGSPLGLERSVTLGVVSSTARQLTPEAPMIYIQTDAAINPGNSGGALVDTRGLVVGVNTLILSQSGGSEGIGFAAPSNIVRTVFEQLRDSGRVRRGEIGLRTQTITPALAAALELPRQRGVLVRDVIPRSPADRADLRIGDVVAALDGKPVENARQLQVGLYRKAVGSGVALELLRGKETLRAVPVVAERPGDAASVTALASSPENLVRPLGVLALDLDERLTSMLPRLRASAGVVVAAGAAGAAFSDDPLRPGDVIYTVDGESVTSVARLRERLKAAAGRPVVLQVERDGELRFVMVELDETSAAER